jgi:REP element-mobilizing transposase RayT
MARAARQTLIDPTQIQIVHVWNRCVRRAFLCGQDPLTGKDFEHRRLWARQRLEHLASVFAIDCITFSIMSNHTHQILRSRPDVVSQWDDCQVAQRWLRLTPKRDRQGNADEPSEAEITALANDQGYIAKIRVRLSDISWWMRYFSHHLACRANREDSLKGHFWESRFGSELLIDNASVLACMIYVDLNPVRAQMAATPEESDYTGAKDRIDDLRISLGTTELEHPSLTLTSSQHSIHDWERLDNQHCGWLSPIEIDEANDPIGPDRDPVGRRASRKGVVAMSLARYLELLDWVGRTIRSDKRSAIPEGLAPILSRIGITPKSLLGQMWSFGSPHDGEGYSGVVTGPTNRPGQPIAVG